MDNLGSTERQSLPFFSVTSRFFERPEYERQFLQWSGGTKAEFVLAADVGRRPGTNCTIAEWVTCRMSVAELVGGLCAVC